MENRRLELEKVENEVDDYDDEEVQQKKEVEVISSKKKQST